MIKERATLKVHCIPTDKFKTNIISILIRDELDKKTVTKNALLAQVLRSGSKKYPTINSIARKTEEMYGSVFDIAIVKKGNEQIIHLFLEFLNDDMSDSNLLDESLEFIREIIFNPLVDNGSFSESKVAREKESLKLRIKAKKDDKRNYALIKCIEKMFADDPFGIYGDGMEEDVDKITPKDLYERYEQLISSNRTDIYIVGSVDEDEIAKKINKLLPFASGHQNLKANEVDILKASESINEIKEHMDVAQGKFCAGLSIGIVATDKLYYAVHVFNEILGGGSGSRLFSSLRERESLCYYANSILYRFKMMIMVEAGIDKENYDEVLKLVKQALEELQSNGVSPKDLDEAKLTIINSYLSIEDNPSALIDFYATEGILGTNNSIENFIKNIESVTIEEVKKACENIKINTVCFLSNEYNQ